MSRHPRRAAARRPSRPNHQRRRADRRARLAFVLLAGLLVGIGATGAYAAKQRDRTPTITFSVLDAESGECGSRPDIAEPVIIEHGAWLNIVNDTGDSATIDTGRRRAIVLPDGSGAAVKLARGKHAISLVPDCGSGVALAVTIEVVSGTQVPDATQSPPSAAPAPPPAEGGPLVEPDVLTADPTGSAGSEGGAPVASAVPPPTDSAAPPPADSGAAVSATGSRTPD